LFQEKQWMDRESWQPGHSNKAYSGRVDIPTRNIQVEFIFQQGIFRWSRYSNTEYSGRVDIPTRNIQVE